MTDAPAADITYEELTQRITTRADELSPRLRGVADHILRHPESVALETVAALAAKCGAPPSALVRLAQTLGFSGFSDLQSVFRRRLAGEWPSYEARLAQLGGGDAEGAALPAFIDASLRSLERLRAEADPAAHADAAARLAGARRVHVLGLRRSLAPAVYLEYLLGEMGIDAVLLSGFGGGVPVRAGRMAREDALVVFSFAPYAPEALKGAEAAAAAGAAVIAVTDGALSPIRRIATLTLDVVEADHGDFRTLAATHCIAMSLAVATAARREAGAHDPTDKET